MSARNTPANRPSPQPLCAAFAPLLPLLSTGALTGEEERSVRDHVATCAWCQHDLATYALVEEAVREYQGADPTSRQFWQYVQQRSRPAASPSAQAFPAGARPLTMEDIMKASEQSRAANESGARNGNWSGDEMNPRPRGRRSVLTTLGAIAATLLIVILAASLFARLSQRPQSPGSSSATVPATVAATAPAQPICNSNFTNSPIQGAQTSVEGVPLPPVTYVVPDNAAGLHGYDLCSSGTAASVSAFLTSTLPTSGWTKGSDLRCFYGDECWTKGGSAISWQVSDPTLWHIAYHPSAG